MRQVNPYHWILWASARRGQFANTGYPNQVPFYQPTPLGDIYVDERDPPPGQDDYAIVTAIDGALNVLRGGTGYQKSLVACLEVYEGVLVGSSPDRGIRIKESGMNPGTVRQYAARSKRWVDNYLYG